MLNATELRKNLFRLLDDVALGAELEVSHKGALLRIIPVNRGSRLSRLVEREGCDIEPWESGWTGAAKEAWEAEVKEFYGE